MTTEQEEMAVAVVAALKEAGAFSDTAGLGEKLDKVVEALNKPTTLNTDNPDIELILGGKDVMFRYMTFNKREAIQVPGFGEAMRVEFTPRTVGNVMGAQMTYYRTKTLYMSKKEFYADIPGKLQIDFRDYCRRPPTALEKQAEERFGRIGTIQTDGTMFTGVDLETNSAMFIEQTDLIDKDGEPKWMSFQAAQRCARERSMVLPTAGQLTKTFNNIELGSYFTEIDRDDDVGFARSIHHPHDYYWTSTEGETVFRAMTVRSTDHRATSRRKVEKHPVRLMKLVLLDSDAAPVPAPVRVSNSELTKRAWRGSGRGKSPADLAFR